jgi:hypothetical protein
VGWIFRSFWGNDGGEVVAHATALPSEGDPSETNQEREIDDPSETNQEREIVEQDNTSAILELQHRTAAIGLGSDEELHNLIRAHHDLAKAVKADDAEVPVYLWDNRILQQTASVEERRALNTLRRFALQTYRRRLLKDCVQDLKARHGDAWSVGGTNGRKPKVQDDVVAMREIMWRAAYNEWFEYPCGSRLHYFRFPTKYQNLARDGVPNFFIQPGPVQRLPQPTPAPEATVVLRDKIAKMINKGYIAPPEAKLRSLIKYFAVPKGLGDWRVVYHAGANGLNDCVWAPSFHLPTVDALVRIVDHTSVMEDRDIGEMFLNFELHKNTRRFVGVDVRPLSFDKSVSTHNWLGWTKNLMGFRSSPYNSVKMYRICEEILRGDRRDPDNAFQWDHVRPNLPGSKSYTPSEGWLTKRRRDGTLASDVVAFVDDERVVGSGSDRVMEAGHTLSSRESYLGIQDALRKLRPATKQPGAWAGVVVHNDPGLGIVVLTSQDKWDRTKAICQHWHSLLVQGQTELPFKQLESDRGFLVYVANAYPAMKPYLKGFHLSLEMWRGGRDAEGWKLGKPIEEGDEHQVMVLSPLEEKGMVGERGPPSGLTPAVPRLKADLEALLVLTAAPTPLKRVVRRRDLVTAVYGFGDASSGGFGSSVGLEQGIHGRFGVWGSDAEDQSSNYRELRNLVETVEEEAVAGRLKQSELWLFTDNSTAESCFSRGSSTSRLLHELVLRLRKLEMEMDLKLFLVHVAGTRMIAQGTDGLSRGMMCEGVMAGRDMLDYVDIASSSMSRHPAIADFIRAVTGIDSLAPLSVDDWFVGGHGIVGGTRDKHRVWLPSHAPNGQVYWWDPPPVIADIALEEAMTSRHKRSDATHIFTLPRLFSPAWSRMFHKFADFIVKLPAGSTHWPEGLHEPLYIGIALPYIRYYPWSLRGTPLLVDMDRELREVLGSGEGDGRNILRQLLRLPGRLSSVSESVARGMIRMPRAGEIPNVPNNGRSRECVVKPAEGGS